MYKVKLEINNRKVWFGNNGKGVESVDLAKIFSTLAEIYDCFFVLCHSCDNLTATIYKYRKTWFVSEHEFENEEQAKGASHVLGKVIVPNSNLYSIEKLSCNGKFNNGDLIVLANYDNYDNRPHWLLGDDFNPMYIDGVEYNGIHIFNEVNDIFNLFNSKCKSHLNVVFIVYKLVEKWSVKDYTFDSREQAKGAATVLYHGIDKIITKKCQFLLKKEAKCT